MTTIRETFAKILIIGDSQVGKSSIMARYCDGTFTEIMTTTIGTDYRVKRVRLPSEKDKEIKLQIWDTAGQERFRCITKNFYREAHGLLLVFDLNDTKSFKNVEVWLRNLEAEFGEDSKIVRYLVGNKVDMPREVNSKDAKDLAAKHKIPYFETSAKTGIKVEEMFAELAKDIYASVIKGLGDSILDPPIESRRTLTNKPKSNMTQTQTEQGGCCK